MKNLPVIAAPPVTPTPAPAPADNNASQATESFGNVLARQYANAVPPQNSKNQDNKQTASSGNDLTTTTNGQITQPNTPDAAGGIAGNVLAVLLPTTVDTNSPAPATKNKTIPPAPAPSGIGTLPNDMLAMLTPPTASTNNLPTKDNSGVQAPASDGLPASTTSSTSEMLAMMLPSNAANGKNIPGSTASGSNKTPSLQIAPAALGASLQAVDNKAASGVSGISGTASTLFHTLEIARQGAATTDVKSSNENTFSDTLAALSKTGAKATQLDSGATKIQMQQVSSPAVDNLLQSGIVPMAASQSEVAQAAQAVINSPVTDRAWGNEFNQKITWMATQHQQTAELHLNPPNLGPLDVVLKVSGDQATALFTSPHAAVRDAVEQALPQLRNMLADSGITLGNAMVSDHSAKDQQAWQASQKQKGNRGLPETIVAPVVTGATQSVAAVSLGPRHLGMVDTFA